MEEDLEFKHVCKFCSKSFPCGRSLGGHMRSHIINTTNNGNSAERDDQKHIKKKVRVSVKNEGSNSNTNTEQESIMGYVLRENRKKTWRAVDSSQDNSSVQYKFCKECGKGFLSCKALFGHMKCHSEKERLSVSLEEQDSWTGGDCQSDNDETAAPSKGRRSKRRTRYISSTAANSSTFSLPNHASSSVSEIDQQEQEEVAMCLMMLSRDVGNWGGLNFVAESSDNNSVFLEAKTEVLKMKKQKEKEIDSAFLDSDNFRPSEFSASGISRNGSARNDRITKSLQPDSQFGAEDSEVELGKNLEKQTGLLDQARPDSKRQNSSKRRPHDSYDPGMKSDSLQKPVSDVLDSEFYKDPFKRSKFECTTCNKIFHSYQALGGHRASHKKTKGCFASKADSREENNIETELSPDPTTEEERKLIKFIGNQIPHDHFARDNDDKAATSCGTKKSRGHECPICLKVFSSGQALGGHKRSHLLNEARDNQTVLIPKPLPEIRDFLDLNLPAPVEEETNPQVGFNQWWVGSSNKHETLVGLISN
ncbi:hypothetical protein SLE2022_291400 [Rubroshorea leprosula]